MRILFILEYYAPHIGGVETLFKSLTEKLDSEGHEIVVLTNRFDNSLPKKEETSNTTIVRRKFYNRYLFTFLAWWPALKWARQADIIHTTSYNAAVPAWIAAKLTHTKSIITFHEKWGKLWFQLPWMSSISKQLHYLFEWMITKFSFDKFVAVSEATRKSLIESGISKDQIEMIYNGINYKDFPLYQGSKPESPFSFLYFGRAGIAKGLNLLLPAFASLLEINRDAQLILILPTEDNPIVRKVMKLIDQYNISNAVLIKNDLSYDALKNEISVADSVVIPSYSEGFCFAAIETMAIGTPIISSGQGALKEVVRGKHITLENLTSDSLTDAMQLAIQGFWEDSTRKEYPLADTIEAYSKLYRNLIFNKGI